MVRSILGFLGMLIVSPSSDPLSLLLLLSATMIIGGKVFAAAPKNASFSYKRRQDSNWVRIIGHGDRDRVDEKWDEDTSPSTGKDHGDEFVGE